MVLHFYGDVGLFEESEGSVVNAGLSVSQVCQFEEIVLQYLSSFLLHVDLLRVPVAKLTVIDPQLGLGIARESEHILAVGTGKTESALAILDSIFVHSLARSALVGGELGDCAVVTAIVGAVDAGVYLFLEDAAIAFALDLNLRLPLLGLLQKVDSGLCQRVHSIFNCQK